MSASDYRELPERVAAAFATLLDAERRAASAAPCCRRCGHIDTLRVSEAEWKLLRALRREYGATVDLASSSKGVS